MSFKLRPLWKDHVVLNTYDRWRKQAEVLKLSKKAKQKLEWFIYYNTKSQKSAATTSRYFGITRKTFYKWLAVFDPANLRALEEGSRTPIKKRSHVLEPYIEQRILQLRKSNPEFGKMKLRAIYLKMFKEVISSWQIQLVIEKYRLQRKPSKGSRLFKKQSISKRKTIELKKQQRPGFLIAFDSIVILRNGVKRYIVCAIDTVSKIAWARMYSTHSSATTKDLFIRLYAVVQGNILNTCQDNGSEFEKLFEQQLANLEIPQYFSRVKTPKDNPFIERFNRTLKEEFLRQGNFTPDLLDFNQRLSKWLMKYNCFRPHQALNYLTPFEYHFNQALVTDVVI